MRPRVLDLRALVFAALGVTVLAPTYYVLAKLIRGVSALEVAVAHALGLALVILSGYELYFALQRTDIGRGIRIIRTRLDNSIPFVVHWVWVYGLLYYLLVCLPVALLVEHRSFLLFVAGGVCVLLTSIPFYLLWPTSCPPEWRSYPKQPNAAKFLAFIQQFDNGRCCIPSLHAAFAAYAATFYPTSTALLIVPGVVCMSCLFVKQHSILDLPLGLVLGFIFGFVINWLM
jgi:hypothetical protein